LNDVDEKIVREEEEGVRRKKEAYKRMRQKMEQQALINKRIAMFI
jgi:hypothetical protein